VVLGSGEQECAVLKHIAAGPLQKHSGWSPEDSITGARTEFCTGHLLQSLRMLEHLEQLMNGLSDFSFDPSVPCFVESKASSR
jgi:hypothetical protein